jgi:hypothetical protein
MPECEPGALAKPGTVAYLLANVERLSKEGTFKGRLAARLVFAHLCSHPGCALPSYNRRWDWTCPVEAGGRDPGAIACATSLTRRGVHDALDWLAGEGLIGLDRIGTGTRRRYGAVTIVATGPSSPYRRRPQGTQFPTQFSDLGKEVSSLRRTDKELSSQFNDSSAPKRMRRTVAGRRPPA